MRDLQMCLDASAMIAVRIVESALWESDQCTWIVTTHDPASAKDSPTSIQMRASGAVYQGSAGIALFLIEAARVLQSPGAQMTAAGALRYAIQSARLLPSTAFGFHAGRVGIAAAASRYYEVFGDEEFRESAMLTVAPLLGRETADRGLDVIAGGAGAIVPLLRMSEQLGEKAYRDCALRLADHLVRTAEPEPTGLSWGTSTIVRRNMLGYAHGVAGIAASLLEAFVASGLTDYGRAAQLAIAHEDSQFDAQLANWPDHRCADVATYAYDGRVGELTQLVRFGSLVRDQPRSMVAWCHGAAGIAPTRARAYEIFGDTHYADRARAVKARIHESIVAPHGNYSLCHGKCGNADALFTLGQTLRDDVSTEAVEAFASSCAREYELAAMPWPSGALNGVSDPSLLLGDAGIGYQLLRVASPDVRSLLFQTIDAQLGVGCPVAATQVQRQYLGAFFQATSDSFSRILGSDTTLLDEAAKHSWNTQQMRHRVLAIIASTDDASRRGALSEAAHLDLAALDLATADFDLSEEYLEDLKWSPVDWLTQSFSMAETAQLIARSTNANEAEGAVLLFRHRSTIQRRVLRPFAALLIGQLRTRRTIEQLCGAMRPYVSVAVPEAQLEQLVKKQVTAWWGQRFLRIHHTSSVRLVDSTVASQYA